MSSDAYKRAGVDLQAGQQATELMKDAVRATYGPEVLSNVGAFGGMFSAAALKAMDAPVLVASTDGVGTKTMVAARLNRWDTVGQDLVNHCINDILVQGARPLFFLDYVASSQLEPQQIADVVRGCALACREANCALLGGETAEMPGVYQSGQLDLVGTIVGVVDRAQVIDGTRVQPGDAVLALPSSGLHTNGYSLARRALDHLDWTTPHEALNNVTIGDALLAVHRCYLDETHRLMEADIDIRAMAHITGGGVYDNLIRVLPDTCGAAIHRDRFEVPRIFDLIRRQGDVSEQEMFHVFNMGLGMLYVVPSAQAAQAVTVCDALRVVGEIKEGEHRVEVVF